MSKKPDVVEEASQESFPASDSPVWNPIVGVGDPHVTHKVFTVGNQKMIHVENGRGEELRLHLAAHGIDTKLSPAAETSAEQLEIVGDVDPELVQTILQQWER